eukprot:NODE_841_length_3770_cov_0.565241.p3 type:complete len:134 gc:universal NODE_841_length_3770_cov_0.565241:1034-633(-)
MFKRKMNERVIPDDFYSKNSRGIMPGIERKHLPLELSFLFGILLAILLIFDLIYYITYKIASLTSQWLVSILILHVISCSSGVMSFIYANEAGDFRFIRLAGISVTFNSVVMVARAIVEYSFQDYKLHSSGQM